MKKYLKRLVPQKWTQWLNRQRNLRELNHFNKYNNRRALHFSSIFAKDKNSDLARLMVESHTLEKGITMPGRRMGFGQDRVRSIIAKCKMIIKRWGADSVELQSALSGLKQYLDIHTEEQYDLPAEIVMGITDLMPHMTFKDENCYSTTKEMYFQPAKDFAEFAHSRHSVRSFSNEPLDDETLMKAIRLAQTAPSACNRQATRVKIISSEEGKQLCCQMQRGNRGFGDRADKWLLITSEMGDWSLTHQQEAFTDGGIFAMNLLYALHYYGIGACTLNALFSPEERELLRKGLGYPESEEPVCFIVVGNVDDEFMVCRSRRLSINDIVQKL